MAQDPKEYFRRLQKTLSSAQQRGTGGLGSGPGPRGAFGGIAGLILLGTGVVVINNALFNGATL